MEQPTNVVHLQVGDPVRNTDDLDGLPPGSKFGDGNHTFERGADGIWTYNAYSRYYSPDISIRSTYKVQYLPDGYVYQPRPALTVERYMWDFRDRALQAAIHHGISYDAAKRTLNQMGTGPDRLPVGPGVQIRCSYERDHLLPHEAVIYHGNPMQPDSLGVFRRDGRYWRHLFGGNQQLNDRVPVIVHSFNGSTTPVDWWTREATEKDEEAIEEFQVVAWELGWQLKRNMSWCSTYEHVMRGLGITSAVTRRRRAGNVRVGHTVAPEVAKRLPVGSVLEWRDENTVAYFLRTESATNAAGTVRIGGHLDRHYRSSMKVVSLPPSNGKEIGWMLPSETLQQTMESLRPGVRLRTDDGSQYVVAKDGKFNSWRQRRDPIPESGPWVWSSFGDVPLTVTEFVEA